MIASVYARKSTIQEGADADAKSVQRQIENAPGPSLPPRAGS